MDKFFRIFGRRFVFIGICATLVAGSMPAHAYPPIDKDFIRTNGADVIIDNNLIIETNSSLNNDEFKQFKWREHLLMQIAGSGASNATDLFVQGARSLAKDHPEYENYYQDIKTALEHYEYEGAIAKAQSLADELIASSAPEKYKLWAKGFLNRLASRGKSMKLQFTAVDGRVVDLARLRGKVVLVDFWATDCGPCKAELPRVKAAWEKFHDQGFEIVGISCNTDKSRLETFLKDHDIPWPQYFDGKQQDDNKFTIEFGIDGIPHMFLVDKQGILRFDHVRAGDKYHPKGDTTSMEQKIASLLAEQSS